MKTGFNLWLALFLCFISMNSPAANEPTGSVLRGRIIDSFGKPIPGATIKIHGVTRTDSTTWPAYDIDTSATSDAKGEFVISASKPFVSAEGAVHAPGFATGLFAGWTAGDKIHELKLITGAALRGKLVRDGKPVANAELHLDNFGRESGSHHLHATAITDEQGRFLFNHLPTYRTPFLYAAMKSLSERGALSKRPVEVCENNSTNDIGEVILQPSYEVSGQIRLSDGKPIPVQSKLLLNRQMVGRMDGVSSSLGADGKFRFVGVPAEIIMIQFRLPGYELTPRDHLLKSGPATNLNIVSNITNLMIEMKPTSK